MKSIPILLTCVMAVSGCLDKAVGYDLDGGLSPDAAAPIGCGDTTGLEPDSPWPMFRGCPAHTGRCVAPAIESPRIKWKFDTPHPVVSSPAIAADGTIYFGSDRSEVGRLYAVNPDGTSRWTFDRGGITERVAAFSVSSPAIRVDGTIYFGCHSDLKFYAVKSDGAERWREWGNAAVGWFTSVVIGPDSTIYFGKSRSLQARSPDGPRLWSFPAHRGVFSSPAIGSDAVIYFGAGDHNLYAVRPDETVKWAFETGHEIVSSPALGLDGTVYVGSYDGKLYAINPDGTLRWAFDTGILGIRSSPGIGHGGTIYIAAVDYPVTDRKLFAVHPDGTQKWALDLDLDYHSSPVIPRDGTVYVGSSEILYAIWPDGNVRWVVDITETCGNVPSGDIGRSGVGAYPAIGADGTIYIGCASGLLAIGEQN